MDVRLITRLSDYDVIYILQRYFYIFQYVWCTLPSVQAALSSYDKNFSS